jgi:hypothetical protein
LPSVVSTFKDAIQQWWLSSTVLRKLGDTLVAFILLCMAGGGFLVYENKTAISYALTQTIARPRIDYAKVTKDLDAFLHTLTFRGAAAIFVLDVDLSENRRRVAQYTSLPDLRPFAEEIVRLNDNTPFVGDGVYALPNLRAIFEGRASWAEGVNQPYDRLIIPIPPQFRQETVGLLVILVKPETSQSNREILEAQAMSWASYISR